MKTKSSSLIVLLFLVLAATSASAFYDPGTQRWLTRDPLQERGGVNLYALVANRPSSEVDYFGLARICVDPNCKGVDLSGFSYVAEREPPNDGPKVFRQVPQPGQCVEADAVYEPGKATKTGDFGTGTISCDGGSPSSSIHQRRDGSPETVVTAKYGPTETQCHEYRISGQGTCRPIRISPNPLLCRRWNPGPLVTQAARQEVQNLPAGRV